MRIRLEHRQFGQSMILGTVLATIGNFLQKAWGKTKSLAEAQSNSPKTLSAENARVVLHVNGIEHTLDLDPRVTLLDALRVP